MRKEDKSVIIEKITEILKEYPNFYLVKTQASTPRRQALFAVPAPKPT